MQSQERRLKNLIRLFIFLVGLIIILFIFFIGWSLNRNPYGDKTVSINELSNFASGSSDKQLLDYIQHDLYMAISYNSTDINTIKQIQDATIREGSFVKEYNEKASLYNVSFIVDIPSIQQSYSVTYQWGPSTKAAYDEWGTQVSCLPKDQLIYGDFNCQDMSSILEGSNDPIMEYLPFKDYNAGFKINAITENNVITNVSIYIYSCQEAEINQIKSTVVLNWFTDKNLDFNSYPITFSSC